MLAHRDDVPFITGEQPRPDPPLTDFERPFWEQVKALGLPPNPSAGPPPWHLDVLNLHTVFGLGAGEPHAATRWRFER